MLISESNYQNLTDEQWNTAHAIAKVLVEQDTDVNELSKITGYLKTCITQIDAGKKLFTYLKLLVKNSSQICHSNKTQEYYRSIKQACCQYLKVYQDQPLIMLQILGWTYRLMKYYKFNIDDSSQSQTNSTSYSKVAVTEKQEQKAIIATEMNFEVGKIYQATITNIQKNKVTYSILGKIPLTNKEPKKYKDLSVDQYVQVEIIEIKEDGSPKKIKLVAENG